MLRAYSTTLRAIGGTGALRWNLLSGALPNGVVLLPTGVIAGLPIQAGTFNVVVRVVDGNGAAATQALTLTVAPAPPIVTTLGLPGGEVGLAYAATLSAAGGSAPLVWSVAAGSLPAGLVLSPSGTLAGIPSAAGTVSFIVRVTGASGETATRTLAIAIVPALAIVTTSVPDVSVGYAYQAPLERTGGRGPYAWSIAAGTLPAGMALGPAGVIHGRPMSTGTSTVTIRLTDGLGATVIRVLTLRVRRPEKAYVGMVGDGADRCFRWTQFCVAAIGVVDVPTGRALKQIPVGGSTLAIRGMVASPDGRRVYFTTYSPSAPGHRLHAIDTASDTIVRSVGLAPVGQGIDVSPDGTRIYLHDFAQTGNFGGSRYIALDSQSLQVVQVTAMPNVQTSAQALTTDGRTLFWVTAAVYAGYGVYIPSRVIAFDTLTGQERSRFSLGGYIPLAMAVTSNGGRLLVSAHLPGSVQGVILDVSVASAAIAGEIATPQPIAWQMIIPDNVRLYTAGASSSPLAIAKYSLVSNAFERSIPTNGPPQLCSLDPARTNLYCTTFGVENQRRSGLIRISLAADTAASVATFEPGFQASFAAIARGAQ